MLRVISDGSAHSSLTHLSVSYRRVPSQEDSHASTSCALQHLHLKFDIVVFEFIKDFILNEERGCPLTPLLNQQELELMLYCNIVYYP